MNRLRLVLFVVLGLALSGTSTAKDRDHDKGHDRDERHDRDRGRDRDRDKDRDRDRDAHRFRNRHHDDHDRDDHRRHEIRGEQHGRKTGWGDCDAPPGQAKKSGCHSNEREHHGREIHHDRDRDHHRKTTRHDHDRRHEAAAVPVRGTPGSSSTAPIAGANRPGMRRVPVQEIRQ